jgi:hypothetical protein
VHPVAGVLGASRAVAQPAAEAVATAQQHYTGYESASCTSSSSRLLVGPGTAAVCWAPRLHTPRPSCNRTLNVMCAACQGSWAQEQFVWQHGLLVCCSQYVGGQSLPRIAWIGHAASPCAGSESYNPCHNPDGPCLGPAELSCCCVLKVCEESCHLIAGNDSKDVFVTLCYDVSGNICMSCLCTFKSHNDVAR